MPDILVIDDEADIRELVAGILNDEGYRTQTCGTAEQVISSLKNSQPKLIFLDIWLEGSRMDGLALLNFIKNNYPDIPVIMISGHGTIETAVNAIKRGAYDFIEKPFNSDRLLLATERALETSILRNQVNELKKQNMSSIDLIGDSAAMKKLRHNIDKVAATNSRIMLLAPSGAGKENVARSIHAKSNRAKHPFVIMNAGGISKDNLEDELFGVELEFDKKKIGLIEEAHKGTLYIDELSDIPIELQNKLLKWLTINSFKRKNGLEDLKVDVRVISASSANINELVNKGIIKKDLYNRLAVVPIIIPALEDRREDIPQLINYFVNQISLMQRIKPRSFADDAIKILQNYNWPGNVRQLRNNIERLLILAGDSASEKPITADMIPIEICDPLSQEITKNNENLMAMPLREARELFEKKYIISKIEMFSGNISKTADNIGMERSALHRKLKLLNIHYKD